MQFQEFPFKVLALAPFHMDPERGWDQAPVAVDRHGMDEVMTSMKIECYLPLDSDLCSSGGLKFRFDGLKSLHPDGIAKSHPFFGQLSAAAQFLQESHRQGRPATDISQAMTQWPDLPEIKIKSSAPKQQAAKQASTVDSILDMVAMPGDQPGGPAVYKNENDQVEALQQKVLNHLFELPAFRQMEAAWRGLRLLLQQGIPNGSVKVEVAAVHAENLEATLDDLTAHLMEDPPGLILVDIGFDNSPLAMERLAHAAKWAATLMVPMIAWCPAGFFQVSNWEEIDALPFIPNHVDGPAYAKYQAMKTADEGRWLGLTCNRFLIRDPYGEENKPRHLSFKEKKPLWISPVWALGTLAAQSADSTGWPTRFTDRHQFCIQDLAVSARGDKPPLVVEAALSRDRHDQFTRAGISPLSTQSGTDKAFFTKAVTVSGIPLAFQLLASRVTAFVLWCKDNLPKETSPQALETQLRLAFQVFSEQSRPPGFEFVEISAGTPTPEGKIPVRMGIKPASAILPSQQVIEMGLDW